MPTLSKSAQQIARALSTPASQGALVTTRQVKPLLDKQLHQAGLALRAVILGMIQAQHRNPITGPQSDIAQATRVQLDSQGLAIDLPDFADELDRGRKPGTYPPFRAILAWVLKYRIQGRGTGASANQIAFAIQRAIYRKGIKAKPFLQDVDKFAQDLMAELIDSVILPNLVQPLAATFNQ
jgi:hypothetical protein